MKRAAVLLAVLVLAGCATHPHRAPITIVVSAGEGVDAADAARVRSVIDDSVQRFVNDGQPLLVSVALTRATVREEPLVNATIHPRAVMQVMRVSYAISDRDGFVVDNDAFDVPVADVAFSRLGAYHNTANRIATRIERLH